MPGDPQRCTPLPLEPLPHLCPLPGERPPPPLPAAWPAFRSSSPLVPALQALPGPPGHQIRRGPLSSYLPGLSLRTLTSRVPLVLLLHLHEHLPPTSVVLERPEVLRVRLGSPFPLNPLKASTVYTGLHILSSASGRFP